MRLLAVFLLAALSCSRTDAVGKCDLRDQLMDAIGDVIDTPQDVVAKIVCHVEHASGFNHSAVNELAPPGDESEVWTLYGLFQLSDHLICSDGDAAGTPNICDMNCSELIDDIIDDDINCVKKLLTCIIQEGFNNKHLPELRQMMRLLFQSECHHVEADEYFADCA